MSSRRNGLCKHCAKAFIADNMTLSWHEIQTIGRVKNIFLPRIDFISQNFSNFAPANSRRADFVRCRSGYREGALHFENASLTLCFWLFETTTTRISCQELSRGGATGRYIPSRSACRGSCSLTHAFTGVSYIPTAWVSLCLFTTRAVVGLE